MSKKKPIIAMDISSSGKGGGPYTSTINLINSKLKDDYDFRLFTYNTKLGRFISFKRIFDIVKQLREINPDIVHFSGLQLSGFHIAIACKLSGIKKSVVVVHGSSTEAMNINLLTKILLYLLESITLLITTTFYGVSSYSSKIMVTKPFQRKSSGFVYNIPVTNNEVLNSYSKNDLGYKKSDFIVVSVGRITKDKGYHILSNSIKDFKDDPRVKFLIIGAGEYIDNMQNELSSQIINGSVRFLGYRDDIKSILPACNVFVLPTLHETLSIALLEASYNSLPLVASNVGGVPEIVKNGINGFLVPAGDSHAITTAINNLVNDEYLCKTMGIASRNLLNTKFSENEIVDNIDKIYKRLLID